MAGKIAVLRPVNQALRMLNACADGKGLLLQTKLAFIQHGKGIARAVADGEDQQAAGNLVFALRIFIDDGAYSVIFGENLRHLCAEMDFAAQRNDMFPHGADNAAQFIGADMRFGIDQDFPWRAEADERAQDMFCARVFCAGVEFAVRECACAALAKLDV